MIAEELREPGYSRASVCYCFILALLLFSTLSLPIGSSFDSAAGRILSALPGVSVTTEVGTFSLTQVRYSDLNIVLPIAFGTLILLAIRNGKEILALRFNAMSAGFLVFVFVASFSACLFREFVEAIKLAIYVLIVLVYLSFNTIDKRGVYSILIAMCMAAGIVNALVTIWQYGSMSGWSLSLSSIRLYRPDGLFGDSIISALMCCVCMAVAMLSGERTHFVVKLMAIGLCLTAGILTGARTFYYLLGIVCVYLALAKTANVSLFVKIPLVLALLVAAVVVVSPIGQSLIDSLTAQGSVSSRELKQQIAIDQFAEAPIFGIGTGQYANVEASLNASANLGLHGTNPHNVYLQVLCENGLVGFIPLMASTAGLFFLALKRNNTPAALLFLLYLAISWTLGIFYSVAFTSFFVALVTALIFSKDES